MEMKWEKLLSDMRIRDLFEQAKPRKKNHRTEYERDYDRAIFCTPVRRLHDKAQVFPLEPNDSVRRRLTHSLEVSTVARDIGRAIGGWLEEKDEIDKEQAKDIETIAATCGLIHDLGNPPFGHAGETAIKEWFKRKLEEDKAFFDGICGEESQYAQDFLRFESNAQTLRLISKLQILSDLYGLNFTCATVSAACKYTVPSHRIDKSVPEKAKTGYFASEQNLIHSVRKQTGTGDARNPITFIVEACDDMVYSVVDLEDAITKNLFDWKTLKEKLEKHGGKENSVLKRCFREARNMIKKPGAVELHGRSEDEAMGEAFRVYAIGELVSAAIETFRNKYTEIMEGNYHRELLLDSKAAPLLKACKDVGTEDVYCAKDNLKLEVMGKHIIHDLMDIFWEAVLQTTSGNGAFSRKVYHLMSENYRTVFESTVRQRKLPKEYCCMQLITDYICGMTDTFASTLHKQLKNA